MICVALNYLNKYKEWTAMILIGYIAILVLLIFWIAYKISINEFNLTDLGLCLMLFILSIFVFTQISRFAFRIEVINRPFTKVHAAAVRGLDKLGLPIIQQISTPVDGGAIEAYDPKVIEHEAALFDTAVPPSHYLRIEIRMRELAEYSTEVRIRVGSVGDMKRSREIFEAIRYYL
jgi:hypothetical protein